MKIQDIYAILEEHHIPYEVDVSLRDYTTLHIGGKASLMLKPSSIEEVTWIVTLLHETSILYVVLGNGSNVVVLDQGYNGVVLVLSTNFHSMYIMDDTNLVVQAGASLKQVCRFALCHELTGLEFACGIPGSVGGGIVMNAGAYGGEMKDVVVSVTFLDEHLQLQTWNQEELQFQYRSSYFSNHKGIVLEVEFALHKGVYDVIQERMRVLMKQRYDKQPMDAYSAGSTFKRPVGNYASALIKQAKLQGLRVGGASVSIKHAGFLINEQDATSDDFISLIKLVQERVKEDSGYDLECEVKFIPPIPS